MSLNGTHQRRQNILDAGFLVYKERSRNPKLLIVTDALSYMQHYHYSLHDLPYMANIKCYNSCGAHLALFCVYFCAYTGVSLGDGQLLSFCVTMMQQVAAM
jgi:hypothetical protein